MSQHRSARVVALAVASVAAGLMTASPAQAITGPPVWKCRASASYTVINGGDRAETVVANGNVNTARGADPDHAQCSSGEAGGGNLPAPLGVPADLLAARSASAMTSIEPELGNSAAQRVSALGRVENLSLQLPQGGAVTVGVAAAESSATGACAGASPQLAGSSRVTGLTLDGRPIDAGELGVALARALASLSPLVTATANETIRTPAALTIRALHLVVKLGSGTVVDSVIAESKVGLDGPVCTPGSVPSQRICPLGSEYDPGRNLCVIRASTSGPSIGDIIVGRPYAGPSGGRVVAITKARRTYGNSPCFGHPVAQFATVGSNRSDRLTGGNRADIMLGLGGDDKLDGGRGNDCLDGGRGSDNLSGALGNDQVFGGSGSDHLNGGPGTDYLAGEAGNDTINSAFGADRAFGGAGRDKINIATDGRPGSASCGGGHDKVSVNANERHRVSGCEDVKVLRG